MKRHEHCWGCGSDHQPPMCKEMIKEPVFCSECDHFYNGTVNCGHTVYRNLKCKSPQNIKEVWTFEKRIYEPVGRPKKINENNDCEWFKRKIEYKESYCDCGGVDD